MFVPLSNPLTPFSVSGSCDLLLSNKIRRKKWVLLSQVYYTTDVVDVSFVITLHYMVKVMWYHSHDYVRLYKILLVRSHSVSGLEEACNLWTAYGKGHGGGNDRWPLVAENNLWSTANKKLKPSVLWQQGNELCQQHEGALKQIPSWAPRWESSLANALSAACETQQRAPLSGICSLPIETVIE